MANKANWKHLTLELLVVFLGVFSSMPLPAQEDEPDHEHQIGPEHQLDHEHHHAWEIGGALGAVFNIKEHHTAPGIHAHLLRNMGQEMKFGLGIAFETILDEHRHLNFGIPMNYNTHRGFIFTATPGVLLKKETDWEVNPSVHLETLYEFTFEHFHMGPMIELALAPDDFHLMLGIHIGFGL